MQLTFIRNDSNFIKKIPLSFPSLRSPIQKGQKVRFEVQKYGNPSLSWSLTGVTDEEGNAVFNMNEVLQQAGEYVGVVSVEFSAGSSLTMQEIISIRIVPDMPRS